MRKAISPPRAAPSEPRPCSASHRPHSGNSTNRPSPVVMTIQPLAAPRSCGNSQPHRPQRLLLVGTAPEAIETLRMLYSDRAKRLPLGMSCQSTRAFMSAIGPSRRFAVQAGRAAIGSRPDQRRRRFDANDPKRPKLTSLPSTGSDGSSPCEAVELPRQDPTDRSYSGWLVLGCALRLSRQIGTE
jgi:hypothetical protein